MNLRKQDVEKVFAEAQTQEDYLVGIYRLVIPNWDMVEFVERWPACNAATWGMIARMAMAWDQEHCPHVMAGEAWMNHGFSCDDSIKRDWRVSLRNCRVILKPPQPASSNLSPHLRRRGRRGRRGHL